MLMLIFCPLLIIYDVLYYDVLVNASILSARSGGKYLRVPTAHLQQD
jgi:hypothetical protein